MAPSVELPMFRKTVHPLDLVLAVCVAVLPGAAMFYWLAVRGRLPFDILTGLSYLVVAAAVMLAVIGSMIAFAVWFFSPRR
jgi:drug/metabolite transporter (DMT)-like permease